MKKLPRPFYQMDITNGNELEKDYTGRYFWVDEDDLVNPYHYCSNGCKYYYRRLCARKNYEATCPWCALTDEDVGFLMRNGDLGGCRNYEYGTLPDLYHDDDKNCKLCIEFNDINTQCARKIFVEDGMKVCKLFKGHMEE